MSKERARRRAEREREAAIRRAARAAEAERRERRRARRARLTSLARRSRPGARVRVGRAGGPLAERRRRRTSMLVAVLLSLNVLVWVVREDWPARLGAVLLTVLAFPVLRLFVVERR